MTSDLPQVVVYGREWQKKLLAFDDISGTFQHAVFYCVFSQSLTS
jgi:hypothetical protein